MLSWLGRREHSIPQPLLSSCEVRMLIAVFTCMPSHLFSCLFYCIILFYYIIIFKELCQLELVSRLWFSPSLFLSTSLTRSSSFFLLVLLLLLQVSCAGDLGEHWPTWQWTHKTQNITHKHTKSVPEIWLCLCLLLSSLTLVDHMICVIIRIIRIVKNQWQDYLYYD